jgi:AcrR family transcriptional regulator
MGVITMGRLSQDPKIRINEILNVAELLFYDKGYHGSSISDSVKKNGRSSRNGVLLF